VAGHGDYKQCKGLSAGGSTGEPITCQRWEQTLKREESYPRTLILEKDNTARPDVGLPIVVAGRKVVKMSMFFTCGNRSLESLGSEMIR